MHFRLDITIKSDFCMNRKVNTNMFIRRLKPRLIKFVRTYYTVKSELESNTKENVISRQIGARIKVSGPLTIADYMKEVLINPLGGYYIKGEGIGQGGDFITSPELGQVFGEMVAIWFLNEWSKIGSPKPFQIVELGPGKGTLMQDILRVFNHFDSLKSASVHLVEVSQQLSAAQAMRLCMKNKIITDNQSVIYREGITNEGVPVKWFSKFEDIPEGFTLLVAHEFFDALPVHKFQKTKEGYREILIDLDPVKENHFRYVISRNETPACKVLVQKDESREHFEVSPDSLLLVRDISKRITENGGLALIADYGHNGEGSDTFRAYRKHKEHDPLVDPGSADLTADVDFAALKQIAVTDGGILTFGPVPQKDFLHRLGIEHRIQKLKESVDDKQKEALDFSYHMMTDEDKMGNRFKFLSIVPATIEKILKRHPLVGFH